MHYTNLFAFLLLCLMVFQNANAEDLALKKFRFSVTGGFDYSTCQISSSSSLITDDAGVVMSDLTVDSEGLKVLNNSNYYRLEQQIADIRAEYEMLKGVSIWCGFGVVTTSMRNSYTDGGELHTKSASENPTFLLKGGISYRYYFKDGFFIGVSPSVGWNKVGNNLLSFRQDDQSISIYYVYELKRDVLRWDVPVTIGRKFGKWTPYIGTSYADYRISDVFKSAVSYVGIDYPIAIHENYDCRCKVNGIVGCNFDIAANLGLKLHCSFSKNIAALISLYFSI